jgi:cytochrome c peroxidase
MRAAFGERLFAQPELAWRALLLALEVFQQHPADFAPYSSKYDAYLRGRTALAGRARGLAVQRQQGQLRELPHQRHPARRLPAVHRPGPDRTGRTAQPGLPANRSGVTATWACAARCGTDLAREPEYCGLFKTPSLRNVATRQVFFHNGATTRLDEAVRFYAERDTRPPSSTRSIAGAGCAAPTTCPSATRPTSTTSRPSVASRATRRC